MNCGLLSCGKLVETVYELDLSEIDIVRSLSGTLGSPLICEGCYRKHFPGKELPSPAMADVSRGSSPTRLSESPISPRGLGMLPHTAIASKELTRSDKVTQLAEKNFVTAEWFTWGPMTYLAKWKESAENGNILDYAKSISKNKPEQGYGLYVARGIWNSATWCDKKSSRLMMVIMENVPSVDLLNKDHIKILSKIFEVSSEKFAEQKREIMDLLNNNSTDGIKYLYRYGNFARLTASKGVSMTTNLTAMREKIGVEKFNLEISKLKSISSVQERDESGNDIMGSTVTAYDRILEQEKEQK